MPALAGTQNPRRPVRDHRHRRVGDENREHVNDRALADRRWAPGDHKSRAALRSRGRGQCEDQYFRDDLVGAKGCMSVIGELEVAAAVETAQSFNRRVNCHARASESVKERYAIV